MSLLTDAYIKSNLCKSAVWDDNSKLYIHPFGEVSLSPVGYDLRVGKRFGSRRMGKIVNGLEGNKKITINPGETILIETYENIGMPKDKSVSGLIFSKVSAVAKGLSHIATTVDADWEGNLLIAVHNPTNRLVELKHQEPFCTLVFFENKSKPVKDSDYPPDRVDNLLRKFVTKERKYKKYIRYIASIAIIVISGVIGYILYKVTNDSNIFVGSIGAGVGLSYVVLMIID